MGKLRIFTQTEIQQIINQYLSGVSIIQLAAIYKAGKRTIMQLLKTNHIKLRSIQETNTSDVPIDIQRKIIYNYTVLGKGLIPSGKMYGVSEYLVKKILREHDIHIRTYTESCDNKRKYQCNDDYFKVQSHNMAYILGLMASNGNVSSIENKMQIQLDEHDAELLEQIRKEMQSTRPIKHYSRAQDCGDTAKLEIYSSAIKQDLAHYGIVPKKTFILQPPTLLKREYFISYIRGYFDGDGSIFAIPSGACWKLGGASKPVIEWMRSVLANDYHIYNNKIYYTKLPTGTDFYYLQYASSEALCKLFDAMYNIPNTLKMKRKYDKYKELLKTKYPRDCTSLDKEEKMC